MLPQVPLVVPELGPRGKVHRGAPTGREAPVRGVVVQVGVAHATAVLVLLVLVHEALPFLRVDVEPRQEPARDVAVQGEAVRRGAELVPRAQLGAREVRAVVLPVADAPVAVVPRPAAGASGWAGWCWTGRAPPRPAQRGGVRREHRMERFRRASVVSAIGSGAGAAGRAHLGSAGPAAAAPEAAALGEPEPAPEPALTRGERRCEVI